MSELKPWEQDYPQVPARSKPELETKPWEQDYGPTASSSFADAGTLKSLGKSLGVGAVKSGIPGLLGFIGDITTLGNRGLDKLADVLGPKLGYTPEQIERMKASGSPIFPTSEDVRRGMEKHLGGAMEAVGLGKQKGLSNIVLGERPGFEYYKGKGALDPYAESIGSFLPGAVAGPAGSLRGLLGNAAKFGVAPGLASEGAAQATTAAGLPQHAELARIIGGLAAPGLAHWGMSPGRVGGPIASEKSYADHVKMLEDRGFDVHPADRADSKFWRSIEGDLFPHRYKENLEAVTKNAFNEVGPGYGSVHVHGPGGTLDRMKKDVGEPFEEIQRRNTMHMDQNAQNDITNMVGKYVPIRGGFEPEVADPLVKHLTHIGQMMTENGGSFLTGKQYQMKRSYLSEQAARTGNPALFDLRNTLDNAFERSAKGTPDEARLPEARRRYQAYLTVKDALSGAGASKIDHITPAALESSAKRTYGAEAHIRGLDPFDWAPSAAAVLKVTPDSGTAFHAALPAWNAAIGTSLAAMASAGAAAHSGHDPINALLQWENLGGAALAPILPKIERPLYNAVAPWMVGSQETLKQAPPYLSPQGLLTAEQATEPARREPLRITVTKRPDEDVQ
jgi:hypothetical protein